MSRDTRHPNRIAAMPKGTKHWNYSANPTVLTLHRRLHRKHGKASAHACVDCGAVARDWSLNKSAYTDNIDDYSPRCRSCHVKYDMTQDRKNKISNGLKLAYREERR